jgi:hypothetical protein
MHFLGFSQRARKSIVSSLRGWILSVMADCPCTCYCYCPDDCHSPFFPPPPHTTKFNTTVTLIKWEMRNFWIDISCECIVCNEKPPETLVVGRFFLPPKGFDWFFFIVFKKHATHSGWILTYLLPSLYSYQIELLRKGVLRYAWENGCWMWFLGLKSDIKLKHGIKFKSEGGWSDSCEHVNPQAWVWFLFLKKEK